MNKIRIRVKSFIIYLMVLLATINFAEAQDSTINKYGLNVINSVASYKKTIAADPRKAMVALSVEVPAALLDLRYAGTNNFMHKKLYPPTVTSYVRLAVSEALSAVQRELENKHMSLKIWDAYRPYSVTEKIWELVKDTRYAADPKLGSGHNRGIAVDLTIVDLDSRKELNMGTGFDNFSDTAHQDFKDLPWEVLKNRQLLRTVMEKWGFKALETEWWHYYLDDGKSYELLDLSFDELFKIQ